MHASAYVSEKRLQLGQPLGGKCCVGHLAPWSQVLIREWVVSISTAVTKAAPTRPPNQVLIDRGMSASTILSLISYSIVHSSFANRSDLLFRSYQKYQIISNRAVNM